MRLWLRIASIGAWRKYWTAADGCVAHRVARIEFVRIHREVGERLMDEDPFSVQLVYGFVASWSGLSGYTVLGTFDVGVRMRWTFLILAVGCYAESDFVPAKTDAFCSLLIECTDPAVLAFDGIDESTCQGVWGPIFKDEASRCKLRAGPAKECVAALESATCPSEGLLIDQLPESCSSTYVNCTDVVDDTDTDAG